MVDLPEIFSSSAYQRAVEFHGHECPGLAIGFRAALLALDLLGGKGQQEEEIVALVETDSCAADAIQVLTGCTFGKGNLLYKDFGKMALTLGNRRSGKAFRVVLRGGALPPDPVHIALFARLRAGSATPEEKERFHQLHREKNRKILAMEKEDLFQASPVKFDFPEKARIMASKECARCGEPTMVTRLEESPAGWICGACQP